MASDTPTVLIDTEDTEQQHVAHDLVVSLLQEARATEDALATTLGAHISMTPEGEYRALLERHLGETRDQSAAIDERLAELGEHRNAADVVIGFAEGLIGQALSLAKGPVDLLRSSSVEEKLVKNARDEAATEAFEIAHYDALAAVAKAVGDTKTQKLARDHRAQEEQMLEDLRRLIPTLARDVVREEA